MQTSSRVILYSFLIAIGLGLLSTVVILALSYRNAKSVDWNKLPSPPEETVAIIQMFDWGGGVVQAKSGQAYACEEGEPACTPLELSPGEMVSLYPCVHIDPADQDFRKPRKQQGQVIDACQQEVYSEIVYTNTMLLYDDNSLWLGMSDGQTLPMYGAEFFILFIFCVGAVPGFFVSMVVLRARFRRREDLLPATEGV